MKINRQYIPLRPIITTEKHNGCTFVSHEGELILALRPDGCFIRLDSIAALTETRPRAGRELEAALKAVWAGDWIDVTPELT
jgi:hypothetical protein